MKEIMLLEACKEAQECINELWQCLNERSRKGDLWEQVDAINRKLSEAINYSPF